MAFPTGWSHKLAITIAASDIDADLTDWTLVFDESFDSVLTQVNGPLDADGTRASINGGGDVRFSSDSAGNNQIAVDVRTWSTDNNPANAECEIAVKVPTVSSSTDTAIYMWWGNSGESQPAANDTYGQYNAYDSDHEAVYTLSESANNSPGGYADRTSNQRNATGNSMSADVDSPVGRGATLDGNNDYIQTPYGFVKNLNTFTFEFLALPDDMAGGYIALWEGENGGNGWGPEQEFWYCFSGPFTFNQVQAAMCDESRFQDEIDRQYAGGFFAFSDTTNWRHHAVWIENDVDARIFLDGNAQQSRSANNTVVKNNYNTNLRIGRPSTNERHYEGSISELRISSSKRANAWIAANYKNQFNTTAFLTWGAIQDVLTGTNLASVTSVDTPIIGQTHQLNVGEFASVTSVDTPIIGQTHQLNVDEFASVVTIDEPVIGNNISVIIDGSATVFGKLTAIAENSVYNPFPLAFQVYRILKKVLGSLLGTYELTYNGKVYGEEPAIAIEHLTNDDGFQRVIKHESGIECIIRQTIVPRINAHFGGANQIISSFEIVLDQHNPKQDLSLAIAAIYATPRLAPLNRNQPIVRQRMRSPDGVVQPARAELKISFSHYQPMLLIR